MRKLGLLGKLHQQPTSTPYSLCLFALDLAADWPAGVQPITNPILCNEDGVRPYIITTRNTIVQDKITCGNFSNKPESYPTAGQVSSSLLCPFDQRLKEVPRSLSV